MLNVDKLSSVNELHPLNILLILIALEVLNEDHIMDDNEEHPLNISLKCCVADASSPVKSIAVILVQFWKILDNAKSACTVPMKCAPVICSRYACHGQPDISAGAIGIVKSLPVPIISSPSAVILHHVPSAIDAGL